MKPKHKSPLSNALTKPSSSASSAAPGWMTKGESKIQNQIKRQKDEAFSEMVPEFWVQDGETKLVRLLSSEPLGQIFRYSMKIKGRYRQYTRPADGEADPFAEKGMYAGLRIIYEVIDVTGYLDKKTQKRKRNMRRFWIMPPKIYETLSLFRKKFGDLTRFNLEVTRTGSGPQTSYTMLPEKPSPMPTADTPEKLSTKLEQYFAPISEEKMRNLCGQLGDGDGED